MGYIINKRGPISQFINKREKLRGEFTMNQNLLTVDELAEILKTPKSWIYGKSRQTGPEAIPRIKVGKYLRFELDKVMVWLKRQNESG